MSDLKRKHGGVSDTNEHQQQMAGRQTKSQSYLSEKRKIRKFEAQVQKSARFPSGLNVGL
jgi:DeoR/GlpR family transcriptional regulator of sugar metabolism